MTANVNASRPALAAAPDLTTPRANRRRELRRFFANPLTTIGVVILLTFGLGAVWPEQWYPVDPYATDIGDRFLPPFWDPGGSLARPLGTDALGYDLAARIVLGGRYSLAIVLGAAIISLLTGVTAGLASGFYRGWLDDLVMRLVDIQLAFPVVILIIAVVAVVGPGFWNAMIVLGVADWAKYARIVRGSTLSVREKEFVEAARALGVGNLRIMARHVLPNVATPLIIFTTFEIARLLLVESALSFLGLGVQPPQPSWGAMIADGRQYIFEAWWASALPGAAIVLVVLAFNFLGDGLRDYLDPRSATDA